MDFICIRRTLFIGFISRKGKSRFLKDARLSRPRPFTLDLILLAYYLKKGIATEPMQALLEVSYSSVHPRHLRIRDAYCSRPSC